MELGRYYDITKKKPVMANGLMRPVLIRTQQLIPLQRNPGMVVALHPAAHASSAGLRNPSRTSPPTRHAFDSCTIARMDGSPSG
uniref:Uncharacterized protein n=1 Tax=Caenorhabditis japonica TaxID=281687 RepID=A0A8R1IF21_CAEJA